MFILYRDTGALWDGRVGTRERCGAGCWDSATLRNEAIGTRERCGTQGVRRHPPTPPPQGARGLVTVAKARSSGRGGGRTPLANQDRSGLGRRPIAAGKQHAPREAGKGRGERRRRPISGREARANPGAGGFGRSFQNG